MNEHASAAEGIMNRVRLEYRPAPGIYDEVLDTDGTLRPRWATQIDQFLNFQSDSRGDDAGPAHFDPFPYIFDTGEWRAIEQGLLQRSRLLNALVADFYGPQALLRRHGLPAALLFANPRYLPQCRGYQPRGGVFLNQVAFDLGRPPDGQWRVLANRSDTPSGLGYALRNRLETDRALPGALDRAGVVPLSGFFDEFANRLEVRDSAPEDGVCIILSGGPHHANHSDHAFLGRQLGIAVAEGHDLRVRQDGAHLATQAGLKPLRTIVRQIESASCDPLELSTDALGGTPGLLACAAGGRLGVENAIGTGVTESAALSGFLPGLCRTLFDEPLMLPDLATWWCGQAREAGHVAANLESLVLNRAFERDSSGGGDVAAGLLPESITLDAGVFREELKLRPYHYVAREPMLLSTMPHRERGGRLRPAPLSLRLFVAASPSGYRVMPGGLARVATRSGIVLKDVWAIDSQGSAEPGRDSGTGATRRDASATGFETRQETAPATGGDRR
ncbi:MAG: circularly permuted type 2 ATP-grasp protein [Gammaproteobacteria bacterium]|nr:circularly permuted type 2 ATP-grasp protein [Gammaproteobacteria bacterium]